MREDCDAKNALLKIRLKEMIEKEMMMEKESTKVMNASTSSNGGVVAMNVGVNVGNLNVNEIEDDINQVSDVGQSY